MPGPDHGSFENPYNTYAMLRHSTPALTPPSTGHSPGRAVLTAAAAQPASLRLEAPTHSRTAALLAAGQRYGRWGPAVPLWSLL